MEVEASRDVAVCMADCVPSVPEAYIDIVDGPGDVLLLLVSEAPDAEDDGGSALKGPGDMTNG